MRHAKNSKTIALLVATLALGLAACSAGDDADEGTIGLALEALGATGPLRYDISVWRADPNDPQQFIQMIGKKDVEGTGESFEANFPCRAGVGRVDIAVREYD